MRKLINYKKEKKIWRRHYREVYIPIYRELGKGASHDKTIRAKDRN